MECETASLYIKMFNAGIILLLIINAMISLAINFSASEFTSTTNHIVLEETILQHLDHFNFSDNRLWNQVTF